MLGIDEENLISRYQSGHKGLDHIKEYLYNRRAGKIEEFKNRLITSNSGRLENLDYLRKSKEGGAEKLIKTSDHINTLLLKEDRKEKKFKLAAERYPHLPHQARHYWEASCI